MLKLIKRSAMLMLAVGSLTMPHAAVAGDDGYPTLNAIGRYFGVGYSYQGYQKSVGPRNFVRQMHPASNYPSSRLLAPYHAGGYPTASQTLVFPQGLTTSPAMGEPTPAQPAPPSKPAGPPPTWLEPYLDGEPGPPSLETTPEGVEIKAEPPAHDSSPSDREDILSYDTAGNFLPRSNGKVPGTAEVNRYRRETLRNAKQLQ